jgi:hypothetical protein
MAPEHAPLHADAHSVIVHLTEQPDGWSVTVSRAGQPAPFRAEHRDDAAALAQAKEIAAIEGADMMVMLREGRGVGMEFVPNDQIAGYVLPIEPPRA